MRRWFASPWRFKAEKYFWLCMILVAIMTGLINSVAFISFLSMYALVLTLAGAEQAAEAKEASQDG